MRERRQGKQPTAAKVEGKQFINMEQCAIDIGATYGFVHAEKLLPSGRTVSRNVEARADELRKEMLPELTEAIKMGLASATTDGWTCETNNRHYITVTFHYIKVDGETWALKWRVLYTAEFTEDAGTALNLNAELKTQCAARGLDPDLLSKVHFVCDGASNLVASLAEFGRSYCFDHCLNISLQTAFDTHLIRIDLFGEEGGPIVDSVAAAVNFLRGSKLRAHQLFKNRLQAGPKTRIKQKQFRSFLAMLRAALNNYDKIQAALEKAGRPDLVLKFSKEDIRTLIEVVHALQKRATDKKKNTFAGSDWAYLLEETEVRDSDSPFRARMKNHLRSELATVEALALITKLKTVVAFFKRSGLNAMLQISLKQDCPTRWNSILMLLGSFLKTPGQILQVNELVIARDRPDLIVTEAERTKMEALVKIVSVFKEESLRCEADKAPTIQFVYLGFLKLQKECQPDPSDSIMIRKVRQNLLRELESHYQPHPRHLIGVFLWPKFRHLKMLSPANRLQVHNNVREMCKELAPAQGDQAKPDEVVDAAAGPAPDCVSSSCPYDMWREEHVDLDEVDIYLQELSIDTNIDSKEILSWWQNRVKRYPTLSLVARSILATPATSATSERVFGMAGRIADKRRTALDPSCVDDLLFLFYSLND